VKFDGCVLTDQPQDAPPDGPNWEVYDCENLDQLAKKLDEAATNDAIVITTDDGMLVITDLQYDYDNEPNEYEFRGMRGKFFEFADRIQTINEVDED
jgi:hypothetical protein